MLTASTLDVSPDVVDEDAYISHTKQRPEVLNGTPLSLRSSCRGSTVKHVACSRFVDRKGNLTSTSILMNISPHPIELKVMRTTLSERSKRSNHRNKERRHGRCQEEKKILVLLFQLYFDHISLQMRLYFCGRPNCD